MRSRPISQRNMTPDKQTIHKRNTKIRFKLIFEEARANNHFISLFLQQYTHIILNDKVNRRVSNYLFVWQIIQQKRVTTSKQTEAPRPRNLILKWSQTGMWFVLLTFVSFVPGIVCLLCFPLCYLLNHHQRLPLLSLFQSTGWPSFANLINSNISSKLTFIINIRLQYKQIKKSFQQVFSYSFK